MRALFDFSFTEFITTSFIKVLYGLLLLGCALGVAFGEIAGVLAIVDNNVAEGLVMMVIAPIAGFFYLIVGRMWMELVIVIFRIAENIQSLADRS